MVSQNCSFPSAGRSYNIDDIERLTKRFISHSTSESISESTGDIASNLRQFGITFEEQNLPVSLMPTIVPAAEIPYLEYAGSLVRHVLNNTIAKFIDEHRRGLIDGPMHRFFTPYYKWWDLIAAENRRNEHILLMRYDAVRDDHGRWTFLETNTACPGGTIHCARIRDAWRMTTFGKQICRNEPIHDRLIDSVSGFVHFMAKKASEISSTQPNIAILNYKGTYTNELSSLKSCHEHLRANGELGTGELLLGDIRDITCNDGQAYLQGKPIALIYNKLDPLWIEPNDPEVQAWIEASTSSGTEFLNSLGAMYLAEAKRTLALLSDPYWSSHLALSEEYSLAIREVIPFTRLVEDFAEDDSIESSLPARSRHAFVLKADALTRGRGVFIGDQMTDTSWLQAMNTTRSNHGVAQLKCHLPSRRNYEIAQSGSIVPTIEFYGIDVFFFGDKFAGLVSRSHTDQIFNIGNGGRESPVLIVGDRPEKDTQQQLDPSLRF